MGQYAVGHDFGGAQGIAAMDQMDFGAEPGEVDRLFAGGIPAADHDERLVAEHRQRAVAGGAIGHALVLQQIFAFACPDAGGWRRWR